MSDLASLGIVVKTTGVQEAEKQLDGLAKAGSSAESSVKGVASTTSNELGKASKTWRQFVAERMGDYMRIEGGHSAAMKRIGAEWATYKASIGKGMAAPQVAQTFDAVGKAAGRSTPAMKAAAMSVNELRQATSQLPAQFTDIVTSLSAGQAPLQVLIQQGGQLKDTFGGIGPAAQAMGSYVSALINPFTLAAAAVVGLGVAWNEAQSEAAGFNRAMILTGNQAGLTAADLEAMAASLDRTTSATQGKSSAVLAQVAQTGQFTAEQIGMVAKAAIQMEEATGRAIGDTVKEFASLKGDPVSAILKLNEAIGDGTNVTRFLTQETLDQIKALKDQGREAEATDVAMRALFGAIDERAPQAVQHMTTLQLVMKDLKEGAGEFGDALVGAFRRADGAAVSALRQLGNVAEAMGPLGTAINRIGGVYGASLSARQAGASEGAAFARDPGYLQLPGYLTGKEGFNLGQAPNFLASNGQFVVDSELALQRIEFEKQGLRYLDDQAKKKRDIADVQRLVTAGVIQQGEAEKRIAQINADYAERAAKRAPRTRAVSERDSGASLLAQIQQQIALTEQEAIAGEKLTASDRLRVQMQGLLASEKAKVSAATREALSAGVEQLAQNEKFIEQEQVYAWLVEEAAKDRSEYTRATEDRAAATAALLDDMQFELSLVGMSNEQRVRAIALREAETRGLYDQTDAYVALAEQIYAAQEAEAITNDIRFAAEDMFASFIDGSKSAGDAFEDFAKSLQRIAAQMLAKKAVQWLFGLFMGGGASAPSTEWSAGFGNNTGWLFDGSYGGTWGGVGLSEGGYTGAGGKHEPAGIVHKGEVVWSQADVARAGGVGIVESMRLRGYADGGVVGMYAPAPQSQRNSAPEIEFNVTNNSSAEVGKPEIKFDAFGRLIVNMAISEVDRRIANMGSTGKAIQQRFGTSPVGVSRG